MKQLNLDLHGKTQAETEEVFMKQLDEARLKKAMIEVTFITGIGVLQRKLKALAEEQGLEWHVVMANPGCIVIYFE